MYTCVVGGGEAEVTGPASTLRSPLVTCNYVLKKCVGDTSHLKSMRGVAHCTTLQQLSNWEVSIFVSK